MTKIAVKMNEEEKVSTTRAVLILSLALSIFLILGAVVGYNFFGGDSSPAAKIDIDYKKGMNQVKEDPDNPQAHIDLGWVYMQKRNFILAEREYQKALNLDKDNVVALYNLALLKVETGKRDEAQKLLEKAKATRPDYIKARATLGFVYSENGSYDKALEEFALVEKHYPGSADLMFQYGRLYEKKGDNTKAKQYFQKALEYDPQHREAEKSIKKFK